MPETRVRLDLCVLFMGLGAELQWVVQRRIDNSRGNWRIEKAASRYALSAYRVLLTRSRRGMVIWVPEGNPDDPSRNCSEIDRVCETLLEAGCSLLE